MDAVSHLLAGYKGGSITRAELLGRLVDLAAGTPPGQIAPLLHSDCRRELEGLSV